MRISHWSFFFILTSYQILASYQISTSIYSQEDEEQNGKAP